MRFLRTRAGTADITDIWQFCIITLYITAGRNLSRLFGVFFCASAVYEVIDFGEVGIFAFAGGDLVGVFEVIFVCVFLAEF